MELLKWSHEINAPDIKYLHLQVVVEGHCIASYNATLQLTFSTPSDELLGVFVHRRLEEPALPDFGLCAEYSVMASVQRCMASLDDLQSFRRWYTSSQQAVRAYPVQVWVITKVMSAFYL
jgi:hypothetical protein